MLMVISPAKTLDLSPTVGPTRYSQPAMLDHSAELVAQLRRYAPADIARLMKLSDSLATLNAGRYHDWSRPFTEDNAKPAVLTFMGDVYQGLDAATLGAEQLDWLQDRLYILSGLYGCLRPLDLMQAYRLEMGCKLANPRGKDLYAFWGGLITDTLNQTLAGEADPVLINLASNEYFKAIQPARLKARIITPVFQDPSAGQYKVVSFHAKRARGLMVRWAVDHAASSPQALLDFDSEGYRYTPEVSSADHWVFRR